MLCRALDDAHEKVEAGLSENDMLQIVTMESARYSDNNEINSERILNDPKAKFDDSFLEGASKLIDP